MIFTPCVGKLKLFITWKSFFKIHRCKNIKQERLECHLYGQLIGILITSSISYRLRMLLYLKQIETSEYKAFYTVKGYLRHIYSAIQKSTQELSKLFIRLFDFLRQNGRKSHRSDRKTAFDILSACHHITIQISDNATT